MTRFCPSEVVPAVVRATFVEALIMSHGAHEVGFV